MSCGMTDKRSQPDEDDMTAKEDFDALRGSGRTSKGEGGPPQEDGAKRRAFDPEAAAAFRERLAKEQDFTVRHAALDLAVELYAPRNGFNSDDVLNTANIFLAWLEGRGATPAADEPEQAPAAPECSPAEMAEIGDIVELAPVSYETFFPAGEYEVTGLSDKLTMRLMLSIGDMKYHIQNWRVLRIVRKREK